MLRIAAPSAARREPKCLANCICNRKVFAANQEWWNKQPPAPGLPDEVAARTSEKYKEAYRLLTGKPI